VADDREEVRPACEEVAEELMENKPHQTVAVFIGAGRVEPQVAEPGMELDKRYNRFALDLGPRDQEESFQVPLISQEEDRDIVVRKDSGSPEGWWGRMKTVFEEEKSRIQEEVDKTPNKIRVEEIKIGSSGDEDAIIVGVIVAGGNSQKAKKKRNKKKRKSKTAKEEEKLRVEMVNSKVARSQEFVNDSEDENVMEMDEEDWNV